MPPLERARAHVTLARAAVLLARLRLRLGGEVLEEGHPLRKEQVRAAGRRRDAGRAGVPCTKVVARPVGCRACIGDATCTHVVTRARAKVCGLPALLPRTPGAEQSSANLHARAPRGADAPRRLFAPPPPRVRRSA